MGSYSRNACERMSLNAKERQSGILINLRDEIEGVVVGIAEGVVDGTPDG